MIERELRFRRSISFQGLTVYEVADSAGRTGTAYLEKGKLVIELPGMGGYPERIVVDPPRSYHPLTQFSLVTTPHGPVWLRRPIVEY